MAMGRGIVLLGVALAIGVYLLSRANVGTVVRASSGVTTTTGATRSAGTSPAARATTTVPLRSPSAVKVVVANGTDVRGVGPRNACDAGSRWPRYASTSTSRAAFRPRASS